MKKDLVLEEARAIIKPEEQLGLVRVSGKSLPAASVVLLTPVGTASFATRARPFSRFPGSERTWLLHRANTTSGSSRPTAAGASGWQRG